MCRGFENAFDFQVIPNSHVFVYVVRGAMVGKKDTFMFGIRIIHAVTYCRDIFVFLIILF